MDGFQILCFRIVGGEFGCQRTANSAAWRVTGLFLQAAFPAAFCMA